MPLSQIPTNFQRLDVRSWGIGIARAVISGGANAVSSTIVVPLVVKGIDLQHMVMVASCTFAAAALIDLCKFLATHPVPDYTEPPQ
jgi:hypothetical protein